MFLYKEATNITLILANSGSKYVACKDLENNK